MPTTLYLKASGYPALRLCDPLLPCPVLGGYDPALMDWSDIAPQLFEDAEQDSLLFDQMQWIDDANVWEIIEPPIEPPQKTAEYDGIGSKHTKRQDDDKRKLEDLIEAAFERVVAPSETPTETNLKQVIRSVRAEIDLDGITASLAQIKRLVNEYAAALKKKADDDEDDLIAFMMLG
jgi:hypothetical protein